LTTGASREAILTLLQAYGRVQNVILLPDKSYSFASMSTEEEALNAMNALNGRASFASNSGPVFMAGVDSVPNVEHESLSNWGKLPEGLVLVEEFISEEEERVLLDSIQWNELEEVYLKQRSVQHFGHDFVYGRNCISPKANDKPFPEQWLPILDRALKGDHLLQMPDQCTANRYQPGQGIPPHVDDQSCGREVAAISLGSGVVMNFISQREHFPVWLPRRSLVVMRGPARDVYSHGIAARTADVVRAEGDSGLTLLQRGVRTSLTFRKRQEVTERALDDGEASALERLHVHDVYEKIADHFSETRHKQWPNVAAFLAAFPSGSVLVDAGCGNGKYLLTEMQHFRVRLCLEVLFTI